MEISSFPLVVGAGPVGLGAALFLAKQGLKVRIVEMRHEASSRSKAMAINPRSLQILDSTGLTDRMLKMGLKIHGACFYRRERPITTLSFTEIHPKYPFMLALSQASTERFLAEELQSEGVRVERGVKMVDLRKIDDGVRVILESVSEGTREEVDCPWLLAADGARSQARQQLGIKFEGSTFADDWHLADVPLKTNLRQDHTHIFFLDDRAFLFLIRVVEGGPEEGAPLWRVLGNRPRPLSQLVMAEQAGAAVWESSFRVSHRVSSTLAKDHVYLAGDAAHIHSPVGARGLNLGLEDAWVFAELVNAGWMDEYDRLRRKVDERVVRGVEILSRIASAETTVSGRLREYVFPTVSRLPFVRSRMVSTVTGLDHDLPDVTIDGQDDKASTDSIE